jgi:hypothetical protein
MVFTSSDLTMASSLKVSIAAAVAFHIMVNVVDHVPHQYEPHCIKTAKE